MTTQVTLLLRHARELLTMDGPAPDPSDPWREDPIGLVRDGAVAVAGARVVAVGRTADVERAVTLAPGARVVDVGDAVVAPGLLDAHTHALFVGDRAGEFALRVRGEGYAAIAARGGGIASSVRAFHAATDADLTEALTSRLARMRAHGATTVEVKTGYALERDQELRALAVVGAAGDVAVPTFLPLHAVPPRLRGVDGGREAFLREVLEETLPAVAAQGVARFVDAYIDGPGFSVAEAEPVLARARSLGLRARLHVGQFEDIGGAELAARLGAASADHLEHVSDAGLRAMADAGVVAVLLPGAAFSLGQPMPDARRMRALGVEVALATDCNPGTSYTESLPLMASFGVRQMGLSTPEAWWALTRAAARALALDDRGRLAPGTRADIAVFDFPSWESLPYRIGSVRATSTFVAGR